MDVVGPLLGAAVFVLVMSHVAEPARRAALIGAPPARGAREGRERPCPASTAAPDAGASHRLACARRRTSWSCRIAGAPARNHTAIALSNTKQPNDDVAMNGQIGLP